MFTIYCLLGRYVWTLVDNFRFRKRRSHWSIKFFLYLNTCTLWTYYISGCRRHISKLISVYPSVDKLSKQFNLCPLSNIISTLHLFSSHLYPFVDFALRNIFSLQQMCCKSVLHFFTVVSSTPSLYVLWNVVIHHFLSPRDFN